MSEICDACRKIAMYTVTIGDRDGLSMVVCEECTDEAARRFQSNNDFQAWMAEVDRMVIVLSDVSAHDLPDCAFRDWFDDGMPPKEAAEMALEDVE